MAVAIRSIPTLQGEAEAIAYISAALLEGARDGMSVS